MSTSSDAARERMAQLFKALGDDTRLRVLELLSGGERCVCELQASLRIAQPLLSFHLRVLRDADLVADRRGGRWAYYSLRSQAIAGLGEAVDLIRLRADAAAEKTKCCA